MEFGDAIQRHDLLPVSVEVRTPGLDEIEAQLIEREAGFGLGFGLGLTAF